MNTMVVRMTLDPTRNAQVDRHFHDDVVPNAKRQASFVSGQWVFVQIAQGWVRLRGLLG